MDSALVQVSAHSKGDLGSLEAVVEMLGLFGVARRPQKKEQRRIFAGREGSRQWETFCEEVL